MIAKRQIGVRIPLELDERLESHVNKIGISKAAFILGLIYKELKKEESETIATPVRVSAKILEEEVL